MTIAIGVLNNGKAPSPPYIIVASDSQTTFPGAVKSLDTQKIRIVSFKDTQVIIAQSGIADSSQLAIDYMERLASGVSLENDETVSDVARKSMRRLWNEIHETHGKCNATLEQFRDFIYKEFQCELIVAYFYMGKPQMFTIDLASCLPVRVTKPYTSIGCGKYVANICLQEFEECDPQFEYAQIISFATLEKTIDNVEGCGRPIWMGFVTPTSAELLSQYEIQERMFRESNTPPDRPFFKCTAKLFGKDVITWLTDSWNSVQPEASSGRKAIILSALSKAQSLRQQWADEVRSQSN